MCFVVFQASLKQCSLVLENMEYNKDDVCRDREIMEKKFMVQDLSRVNNFVVMSQQLYPSLERLPQMMVVLDILMEFEKKINGQTNCYGEFAIFVSEICGGIQGNFES